ncbi:MAG: hypothetical protein CL678_05615 [Bdellovibrionaceae bacterium]|nr:hypothetical protein [Pseudobdellovibrionaceae bacterium]
MIILSLIAYIPLILISLLVVYAIINSIWSYYMTGNIPNNILKAMKLFRWMVFKLLLPIKWLLQLLWWLFPITPNLRNKFNEYWFDSKHPWPKDGTHKTLVPLGAWADINIARSGLLLLIIAFITICSLIFKYGYPNTLVTYSRIINISLLVLGMIFILLTFIAFHKNLLSGINNNPFPTYGNYAQKNNWFINSGGSILFYSIGVSLALAILTIISYLVIKYSLFSVGGLTVLMIVSGLAGLLIFYNMLKSNPVIEKMMKKSKIFSSLFYLVFIIPCLFGDTVRFLYNHLRHTPKFVYSVLGTEIILILLFLVLPMLKKYIYTLMPPKDNKKILLKRKLMSSQEDLHNLKTKIQEIKKMYPTGGKIIDDYGWKNIISNNLNDPKNIEELQILLINYGYTTKQMCQKNPYINDKEICEKNIKSMIKIIKTYTPILVGAQQKVIELNLYIKDLENQMKRLADLQKGKVLLMKPVYLKNKRYVGGFHEFHTSNYDIEYSYNYGISCWVFIRAQPPSFGESYNKYTSILNYGDKPNLLYNGSKNTLQIRMNNGNNKKKLIHNIKKFPLQRWNNIVINYDSGILDIFLNSKLVASYPNILPYMNMDRLSIGEDNGIGGGICNVVYFPAVLSKERIDINYKLLQNKYTPII